MMPARQAPPRPARAATSVDPSIALLPWGDRFEDFHDRIGLSLEDFRDRLTGTWLLNYVEALQLAGVRPLLFFVSAHVREIERFTHAPSGAPVRVLPAPWLHRKLQGARDRLGIRAPLGTSLVSYAATPWCALARELQRDGCSAILCHEYEYARFDEAVLMGRVLRIPVFATYQGAKASISSFERLFRRSAVRHAAGLVIGSRHEMARVRAAYSVPEERMACLPNTFDVWRWQPLDRRTVRRALDVPQEACVVAWQGRVEIHRKGLDVLLDAWERLCTERPGAALLLLLAGSGRDAPHVRRRVAALPPRTVRWDERFLLDRALLWQYLSAADIAALPSRHEGFAVTVIEAMACGLPVVAADVCGVREALGAEPAGIVVPPGDAGALAAALGRLMDDRLMRQDLGARARRRAEREFSFQVVGRRLRSFLERQGGLEPHA